MQSVVVLLDELARLVADGASEVADEEALVVADLAVLAQLRFARQSQPEMRAVGRVDRRREVVVARFRQLRLLVEQMEDAVVLGLDQIDAVLIVDVDDLLDAQTLLLVQRLLLLEDALVEELLQLLVAVVDAKLFETVDGEVLEASDVQHADVVRRRLERDALVDAVHDVVEQAAVDRLSQCVSRVVGLVHLRSQSNHRRSNALSLPITAQLP